MKQKTSTRQTIDIHSYVWDILDRLNDHIDNYKAERLVKQSPEDAMKWLGVDLHPEILKVIHQSLEDKETRKEMDFKDGKFIQYLEEEVGVYDCFETMLARITCGEDVEDIECELDIGNGSMENRDWVNPHWENYKNRVIKLTCFYCACATLYEDCKQYHLAVEYLMRASEVNGIASRLPVEVSRNQWTVFERVEGATTAHQKNLSVRKKTSENANAIKSADYLAKVEYAKQKWIELPTWHSRFASETADKLIKEFSKSVPAKDKLVRLISEWKQQSKK